MYIVYHTPINLQNGTGTRLFHAILNAQGLSLCAICVQSILYVRYSGYTIKLKTENNSMPITNLTIFSCVFTTMVVPLIETLLNLINSSIEYYSSYQYRSHILLILTLGLSFFIVFGFIAAYIGHRHCFFCKQYYMDRLYFHQWYEWVQSYGHFSTSSASFSTNLLSCKEPSTSGIDAVECECHDFGILHFKSINDDFSYNEEHYDDTTIGTDFLSELYETESCNSALRPPSLLKIERRNVINRSRLPNLSLNYPFSSFPTFDDYAHSAVDDDGNEKERCNLNREGLLRVALNRKADFATIVSRLSQFES